MDNNAYRIIPPIACPVCQSRRMVCRNYGSKVGAGIGTVAGFGAGVASVLGQSSHTPPTVASVMSALLSGLASGAAGCAAGAKLGQVVDQNVLDNYICLDCHCEFSPAANDAVY